MRALSAPELLRVWEWGLAQPAAQRALALLAAACPHSSHDALAKLCIGQRDARLLTLREWAFGPQLVSLASCPGCGERLELSFSVSDIRVADGSDPLPDREAECEPLSLSVGGYEVCFRLPNSLDLAAIEGSQDIAATRHLLLERCLVAAERDGQAAVLDQLPAEVTEAVVARMDEADPQANVQLALSCSMCGHVWQATFDIVSFFWSEINAWAYRTLHQVHRLASAYGWREADILALSPWRRQFYLDLVNGV
jgi:hypothetical protein